MREKMITEPNEQTEKFISFVKQKCKDYDVKLILSPEDHVATIPNECKCNGYFDDDNRALAVATGKSFDKWFKTLVHEFGHMTQWIDGIPEWKEIKEPADAEVIIELWYDKLIELESAQKQYWLKRARNVELDCERRTVRLIKRHNLPIDTEEYSQHANAYVYFWNYTMIVRSWYKIGKEPYNIPEIVSAMPKTMDNDYDKLPPKYRELFDKYLINIWDC